MNELWAEAVEMAQARGGPEPVYVSGRLVGVAFGSGLVLDADGTRVLAIVGDQARKTAARIDASLDQVRAEWSGSTAFERLGGRVIGQPADELDDRDPENPVEWDDATADGWDFDSDPDWR